MRFVKGLAGLVLCSSLIACASARQIEPRELGWIEGCWETASGDYREVWRAEGQHLFGFAVAYKDGAQVFFEQTRIDLGAPAIFNAYPAGQGPSAFTESARGAGTITFENAAHDYPQKIVYARGGQRLNAAVSLKDGSQVQTFAFQACGK